VKCKRTPARGLHPRFEARWLEEEACESIVRNAWEREVNVYGKGVRGAVNGVLGELADWSRNVLGDLEKRIGRLKKELEKWRRENIGKTQVRKEAVLRYKLSKLEEQKEIYWKQRAHVHWMKEGDRNTKYFHTVASERKKLNKIVKLKREDGVVVEEQEAMKEVATNYFSNLFSSSSSGVRVEELLCHVDTRVTQNMNEMLCKEYTSEEVTEALQSIGDLKAPGPDGMHSIFYKKFWEVVGEKVTSEVLGVLNGGPMPEDWNDTCVVLIPKINCPEDMKDFRPISLCNVVYKLISKIIANRLKQILPEIISPNQSAFVPGRLITDNILLAYECTHFMKNKYRGKEGYAAIKLDMSKAYDRVEWSFIEKMLRKLGFAEQWIKLVMVCISSVKYQVRINGELTDVITPERGLRQGDPLSPYLFLICAEGFSALLNGAEVVGELEGIQICNEAPRFNHLLFAADSLVLIKANKESAKSLQKVLQLYEICSGQTVNYAKSSVMFSANTREPQKQQVLQELNIRSEARTEKYLGLPVYVGRSRTQTFAYIKDKVWKRIQGWKEKMLSKAGKDILIKAIAQAIPTFAMSCFDLTKTLCDQMSSMICRYWWAQQDNENKIHWISWDTMTKSKKEGGLGFRELYGINLAMLARQAWRLLTNPESLCARVLKAKYFPNSSILDATAMPGISYTWRSILKGVELVKEGMIWRVGDGININMWTDPWLARDDARVPITPRRQCLLTKVNELLDPVTGGWDEALVRQIFWEVDVKTILATPVQEDFEDYVAWQPDSKGFFSVKSAYKVYIKLRDRPQASSSMTHESSLIWTNIWQLQCMPKVQQFMWRLAHNSLPVKRKIEQRGIECDTLCVLCRRLDEDGAHLFLKCKQVKQLWSRMGFDELRDHMCTLQDPKEVVQKILELEPEKKIQICCTLWCWWSSRNKLNAEGKGISVDEILRQANHWVMECKQYYLKQKGERETGIERVACRWIPPDSDIIKVNIDGAFSDVTKQGGWGFVARDNLGEVRGSGAGCIPHVASALQSEAIACLEAVQAAAAWGMGHVQVETDCKNLVTAVNTKEYDGAPEGVIFREIRSFVQLNFISFNISYCPRDCNKVSHALAAWGTNQTLSRRWWLDFVPDDFCVLVASELAEPV
jgi:hypothetical protein